MKNAVAALFLLVLVCPMAIADEPTPNQRFAIVESGTRTFLLDTASGDTWVLDEAPSCLLYTSDAADE